MAPTVLVADDSPTIQNKAKGILMGEGLEVVTVSNGVAAVKEISQIKPSLILADVSMPGRDGYEVCEYVKKSAELNHIPVLLLFSDTDPYDEVQGARVGANGRVRKMVAGKPLDPQVLISTVNSFLAQATMPAPPQEVVPAPLTQEFQISSAPTEMEIPAPPKEVVDLSSLPEGASLADAVFEPHASSAPEHAVIREEVSQPAEWASVSATNVESRSSAVVSESREGVAAGWTAPAEGLPLEGPTAESEAPSAKGITVENAVPQPSVASEALFHTPAEILETLSGSGTGIVTTVARAATPGGVAPSIAAPAADLDTNLIYMVVWKVVTKMSPSVLSPETASELARKLTDEIISEISSS